MVSEIFHWVEERTCDEWAKPFLEQCLRQQFDKVLSIDRMEFDGNSSLSRKYGKVICLFNFDAELIDCSWLDEKYGDPSVTFNITIPNLSSFDFDLEVELHKYPGAVSSENQEDLNSKCSEALKNFKEYFETEYSKDISEKMKKFGQKNMKDSADKMYEDLAVIDEVKDTASQSSAKVHNSGSDEHTNANNNPTKDVDSHHYDGKLNFELSEDFNHGLAALYKLFTEDSSLSYLTNTTCDFTLEAGAKFTWIDGQIEGICVEYLNEELLALDVRFSSWPADAKLSRVIVKFEKKSEDLIHITIRQYNIESNDDVESFKSFWNSQFFENIRRMCGQIM